MLEGILLDCHQDLLGETHQASVGFALSQIVEVFQTLVCTSSFCGSAIPAHSE